jgi:hypothetical protein
MCLQSLGAGKVLLDFAADHDLDLLVPLIYEQKGTLISD